ncbi:hypothetical protein DYB37_003282 [Aphanomyces astaci]|uniref:Uncharacterized protein n=1 Tax=Aphanomyces astaci TaxID=112090 RepID=A0A3R6X002_APHAT|nr:hypothetical protein DYB35_002490 [Aphanomyces astaci]RHZ06516.1 hypothetical protein DYB37_003282 [Aphanomyces astaci]
MSEASSLDDDSWISKSNWHRPDGTGSSDQDKLSLRYLDEFVGDLTCSAQMLAWGLFPDAKEVSETMGVFNAVRKLGLHEKDIAPRGVHDGIVIVGDGVTPRTAAMFAYRTKGWTCYSVDPIMKVSTIRIRLRKAIVVLVHAHVTIEQAMVAIDATEVVAVLTLPWHPDIVYDDLSILSVHREVMHFHPSSRVGVIGRQDGLVSALTSRGFTAIHSIESDYAEQGSLSTVFNVVLDCGSLHLALNRTEKTKSGNLVGSLCQLWQSWLDEDLHPTGQSGAVVVVSSRRMLRSSKFLNRYRRIIIAPLTRVQTLHVNLSFVDLETEDGATTFVLLRRGSLPQDQVFSMPRALMQYLQLGDVLQVTGTPEPTKNGSSVVVASAVRVVQWVSRDTLVYFNYN